MQITHNETGKDHLIPGVSQHFIPVKPLLVEMRFVMSSFFKNNFYIVQVLVLSFAIKTDE